MPLVIWDSDKLYASDDISNLPIASNCRKGNDYKNKFLIFTDIIDITFHTIKLRRLRFTKKQGNSKKNTIFCSVVIFFLSPGRMVSDISCSHQLWEDSSDVFNAQPRLLAWRLTIG